MEWFSSTMPGNFRLHFCSVVQVKGANLTKYFIGKFDSRLEFHQSNQSCDKFKLLLLVNSSIESNFTLDFFDWIGSWITTSREIDLRAV